jgi:hypothetical protein
MPPRLVANVAYDEACWERIALMDEKGKIWQGVYERRSADKIQQKRQERTAREGRILAIDGCFDHWTEVMPFVRAAVKDVIEPVQSLSDVPRRLSDYHLVAIGCPGNDNGPEVLAAIRHYLEDGGFVLTTDLCLGYVVEPWLDGSVGVAGSTPTTTVSVELAEAGHPLLKGLTSLGRWEIHGGGHAIAIYDDKRVRRLLISRDLGEMCPGGDTIMFECRLGAGTLVHFVSHAYAQTSDLQGAQAAAMILANLFDLATEAGAETGKIRDWFRLRSQATMEVMTVQASAPLSERSLTRSLAKSLFERVADESGNSFYKYLNKDGVPILEFEFVSGKGWRTRVPGESRNSFILNGKRLSPTWEPIKIEDRLVLFSKEADKPLADMEFIVAAD